MRESASASTHAACVVVEPGMCGCALYGNREILALAGRSTLVRIGKARSRSR